MFDIPRYIIYIHVIYITGTITRPSVRPSRLTCPVIPGYMYPFFAQVFFWIDQNGIMLDAKECPKNPGLSVTYLLHCPEIKTLIPINHSYFLQVPNRSGKMRSFRRYKCSEVEIFDENFRLLQVV